MAIEGPLRELGLPDLLQLLALSRKTGILAVRDGRGGRSAVLELERGALVGARAPGSMPRLGQLLLTAGKATMRQLDAAAAEQASAPGTRIGEILVERLGVPRVEVERQLRFQVEETVFDLVRWDDGDFRFEESPLPSPGSIPIRVPTEGVLMEALRRVDEWSAMGADAPGADVVPGLVESGAEPAPRLSLQAAEWEVLAAVDGERSLRAIARELGQGEFEVAKVVFALVSAGVVELRDRRARADAAPQRAAPTRAPEAAVAEAIAAGRLEQAERELEPLLRGEPERAELHALGARLDAARGDWSGAVERLQRAIRHDPLLGSAYYALGMAALRAGDFRRAGEALRTYLRLPDASPALRERARRAATLAAEIREVLDQEVE